MGVAMFSDGKTVTTRGGMVFKILKDQVVQEYDHDGTLVGTYNVKAGDEIRIIDKDCDRPSSTRPYHSFGT